MDISDFALPFSTINTMRKPEQWLSWFATFESNLELFESKFDYDQFMDEDDIYDSEEPDAYHGLCLLILRTLSAEDECVIEALGQALFTLSGRPLWEDSTPTWPDIYTTLQSLIDIDDDMVTTFPAWWVNDISTFSRFLVNVGPNRKRTAEHLSDALGGDEPENEVNKLATLVFLEVVTEIDEPKTSAFPLDALQIIRNISDKHHETAIVLHNKDDDIIIGWEHIFGERSHVTQAVDYLFLHMFLVAYKDHAVQCLATYEHQFYNTNEMDRLVAKYTDALAVVRLLEWDTFELTPVSILNIDQWIKPQLEQLLTSPALDADTKRPILRALTGGSILS